MQMILYFLLAILATTIGAITGMGGGVMMKPVMDMLAQYDVASISMLSSITVFTMSVVSVARQRGCIGRQNIRTIIPLAAGAVIGGNIGATALKAAIAASGLDKQVTLLQNVVLAALIIVVCVYTHRKDKLPTLGLQGLIPSALVGLTLGFVSSFLGIGGGPINVALIIFAFSVSTKTAAVYSVVIILFSQGSKLAAAALGGGFAAYNLTMLAPMVPGAIGGGFIGAYIHKRISEKTADRLFIAAQVLVLLICLVNMIRSGML